MIHTIFHQIVDQLFELTPLFWEIVEQVAQLGPGQDAHFANLIWPPRDSKGFQGTGIPRRNK